MANNYSYQSIMEPIIYTASRLETLANKCFFTPMGLNIASFKIMGLLYCQKKAMNPTEIMEIVGGTKSNISQRLDFLEKKGFIEIEKNNFEDKRKLSVKLTLLGKEKVKEIRKYLSKVKLELEANFSKEEIDQHFTFFNKLNKLISLKEKSL